MWRRQSEKLPEIMQNEVCIKYFNHLHSKRHHLFFKRFFDLIFSITGLILTLPIFIITSIAIKLDSKGPVFFKQIRVGKYGKPFKIYKFRTMVQNAEAIGTQVTLHNDKRITRVGRLLRAGRLDEIPQLINIFLGEMSSVGPRPEVPKYVHHYDHHMLATLLIKPGLTGTASIEFRNENELLKESDNPDKTYITEILPQKCKLNLEYIEKLSIFYDFIIIIKTISCIFG